jgi:hypothetical protein
MVYGIPSRLDGELLREYVMDLSLDTMPAVHIVQRARKS